VGRPRRDLLALALSSLAALSARPFDSLDDVIDATLRLMSDWIGVRLSMIHRLEGDNIAVSHVHDRMGLVPGHGRCAGYASGIVRDGWSRKEPRDAEAENPQGGLE